MFSWFSGRERAASAIETAANAVMTVDEKNIDELKTQVDFLSKCVQEWKDDVVKQQIKDLAKRVDDWIAIQEKEQTILYYDGSFYRGEVKRDAEGLPHPHGFGIILYSYGSRYVGHWEDGLYHGSGIFYKDASCQGLKCEWVHHRPIHN